MRKKAVVLLLLCVMGLATIGVGTSEAAWYVASIAWAGASGASEFVVLSDTAATPAFTNTWFTIDSSAGQDKAMLASALTAVANGTNVSVNLSGTAAYSLVYGLFAGK
jgi:hypothetical protein